MALVQWWIILLVPFFDTMTDQEEVDPYSIIIHIRRRRGAANLVQVGSLVQKSSSEMGRARRIPLVTPRDKYEPLHLANRGSSTRGLIR